MAAPLQSAPPGMGPPPPRGLAALVWAAMAGVLVVFLAMVLAVERPANDPSASPRLIFWTAVVSSVLGIVLSRTLPPRIPARQTGGQPGANAFIRLFVAWGLCESVAIFPLVGHMLVHDRRLLAIFAVDLLALLTLYPSRDVWARLASDRATLPPQRTER